MTDAIAIKREAGFAIKAFYSPAQTKHQFVVSHFDGTTVREATSYVTEKELRAYRSREACLAAKYALLFRELAFTLQNVKVLK